MEPLPSKRCPQCNTVKPLDDFPLRRASKDGRYSYCRKCNVRRVTEHRARPGNVERKAAYDKARVAILRDELKAQARARYLRKRPEKLAQAREWVRNNPAGRRAIANAYKARRRSLNRDGMSGRDFQVWLLDQLLVCSYCGCACQTAFDIDHVHPLSRGGAHAEDNLTVACVSCNRRKSNKTLLQFLRDRGNGH